MAHPVLKIKHPQYTHDFYLIWDTCFELPETIPMDLTNFIDFFFNLFEEKFGEIGPDAIYMLSTLIKVWDNIKRKGISFDFTTIGQYLSDSEYKYLVNQIEISGGLERAEKNLNSSRIFHEWLQSHNNNTGKYAWDLHDLISNTEYYIEKCAGYFYNLGKTHRDLEACLADNTLDDLRDDLNFDMDILKYENRYYDLYKNGKIPAYM